jgi:hypothetical protein
MIIPCLSNSPTVVVEAGERKYGGRKISGEQMEAGGRKSGEKIW